MTDCVDAYSPKTKTEPAKALSQIPVYPSIDPFNLN